MVVVVVEVSVVVLDPVADLVAEPVMLEITEERELLTEEAALEALATALEASEAAEERTEVAALIADEAAEETSEAAEEAALEAADSAAEVMETALSLAAEAAAEAEEAEAEAAEAAAAEAEEAEAAAQGAKGSDPKSWLQGGAWHAPTAALHAIVHSPKLLRLPQSPQFWLWALTAATRPAMIKEVFILLIGMIDFVSGERLRVRNEKKSWTN